MTTRPIKIPWALRLRRWRERFAPPLVFLVLAGVTIWLWDRHTGHVALVGEVEFVRIDLASPAGGVLLALPGAAAPMERFDRVVAGQVVARLDDRPTLAALATLQTQIVQSRNEVAAAAASIEQERADVLRADAVDITELALDLQRQRLNALDRRGAIERDRIELQRLNEELEQVRRLAEQQAETAFSLRLAILRRDVLARQIEENEQALAEAIQQVNDAEQLLQKLPAPREAAMHVLVQPLQDAVDVLDAQMRELEIQVSSLQIRAPISGEIAAVHARPGQAVVAGQPILTIADPLARSVVVYFRERAAVWPEPGMKVAMHIQRNGSVLHESTIAQVGAQIELVPEQQRKDPLVPEWGLPVRINLPEDLTLYPGELVGILIAP